MSETLEHLYCTEEAPGLFYYWDDTEVPGACHILTLADSGIIESLVQDIRYKVYYVGLVAKTQKNLKTGWERPIRRIIVD